MLGQVNNKKMIETKLIKVYNISGDNYDKKTQSRNS